MIPAEMRAIIMRVFDWCFEVFYMFFDGLYLPFHGTEELLSIYVENGKIYSEFFKNEMSETTGTTYKV